MCDLGASFNENRVVDCCCIPSIESPKTAKKWALFDVFCQNWQFFCSLTPHIIHNIKFAWLLVNLGHFCNQGCSLWLWKPISSSRNLTCDHLMDIEQLMATLIAIVSPPKGKKNEKAIFDVVFYQDWQLLWSRRRIVI